MKYMIKNDRPFGFWVSMFFAMVAFIVLMPGLNHSPIDVSAYPGETFGPACGIAAIDGNINPVEWLNASTQTFLMVSPGGEDPFTATLSIMNSEYYLYMGITINDDEFSVNGLYLPEGDTFRIDFDNDHSGSLFGLGDDVLGIHAGLPQFSDNFISGDPAPTSSDDDADEGGRTDGIGFASRRDGLNHFELRHPLCSGDALDFCLQPTDLVGFRLEYLDAEGDGSFGSSQFYPGTQNNSEATIVISQCALKESALYLPVVTR